MEKGNDNAYHLKAQYLANLSGTLQHSKWSPVSIYQLCNNYVDQAAVRLLSDSSLVTFNGSIPFGILKMLQSPLRFSGGNSGGSIQTLSSLSERNQVNVIIKSNKNEEMNDYEFAVYNMIKDENVALYSQLPKDEKEFLEFKREFASRTGLPSERFQKGSLLIEDLGESSLESEIKDKSYIASSADVYQFAMEKGKELARMISKYDLALDSKMQLQENAGLAGELEKINKFSKLEKIFGVESASAKNNYYILNIIKSLPNAGTSLIEALGPVAESLKNSFEKYGMWSIDIKPDNVFYVDGKPKITDFNYARKASMQEIDAVMFDDVIPIRDAFTETLILHSPWNENDKIHLINERISEYERISGKTIDRQDYMNGRHAAAFYISLRRANQTLAKLANSRSYIEINKTIEKLNGYITNAFGSFGSFCLENSVPEWKIVHAAEEINHIYRIGIDAACPSPVRKGLKFLIDGGLDSMREFRDSGLAYELQTELDEMKNNGKYASNPFFPQMN